MNEKSICNFFVIHIIKNIISKFRGSFSGGVFWSKTPCSIMDRTMVFLKLGGVQKIGIP